MNVIKNRWISIELEMENPNLNLNSAKDDSYVMKYRDYVSSVLRTNFKVDKDYSLLAGGLEVTGNMEPLSKWIKLILYLGKEGFVVTTKCGLHIHIDVRDIITDLKDLKSLVQGILKVQRSSIHILKRHTNAYHNLLPPVFLEHLLESESIEDFAEKYLSQLRGGQRIKNPVLALKEKKNEHNYWIDLSPILRQLLKVTDKKHPVGSIEIRGKASPALNQNHTVDHYEVNEFKTTLKDLLYLGNRILVYVKTKKFKKYLV